MANYIHANASVLLDNENDTFQKPMTFSTGIYPASILSADLNNDNKQDLAVTIDHAYKVSVLLGNDDEKFW